MNQFQELFDKQKAYFNTDITKSYEWRIEQLDRLERLLIDNQDEIKEALGKDFKTALNEQAFEILAPLGTIAFTKSQLKEWMKPVPAPMPKELAKTRHTAITYREPYGVSLVIGPFNGPVILLLLPAIAALSAGNTVILKTSEAVPASAEVFARYVAEYFEPEAVAMVRGDKEVVTELLALPFGFMFFTGSVKVGKIVMRAAAENLTPVLPELGGQNPAIVDATANVKDAARKIAWGATAWGGQWCTSPGYAYVRETIVEEFFILNSVSFGGGAINQSNVNLYVESMPYGGVGNSGVGNYYGKYGYEALTHPKSILIFPRDLAIEHLFPPFTKETAEAQQMWFDY